MNLVSYQYVEGVGLMAIEGVNDSVIMAIISEVGLEGIKKFGSANSSRMAQAGAQQQIIRWEATGAPPAQGKRQIEVRLSPGGKCHRKPKGGAPERFLQKDQLQKGPGDRPKRHSTKTGRHRLEHTGQGNPI